MKHEKATLQTKTAISASLKKFMEKKPLRKITVSEIIADCDINRNTFYYHFEDIYDLLKWTLEQEAIEVVKKFNFLIDTEDAVRFVIRYVAQNAHMLNCAYDTMGRDELKRFFYNDFITIIRGIVDDCEATNHLSVSADFKSFLCDFLTEATSGILVNGFQNQGFPNEDEIVKNITTIVDALPDVLRRAETKG